VIANRGTPVARLVPVSETTVPGAGDGRVILEWLAANRLPPYARRTPEEIDAGIAEERASWN
jgi:antitoxin (DNA-binding transcriptional repressor) of toxin-antitoxin stability system